ncbi:MAG: hypothetical protein U1F77_16425 [Kiritimatiellia bacterium]
MQPPSRFSAIAILLALHLTAAAAGTRPSTPLAAPGPDGHLVYAAYNPEGDRLPDFSNCGYRGGGVALPHAPVRVTLAPTKEGDDRERIQQALDGVAALPLDKDGLRGAVLLRRGLYRVGGMLTLRASGVVLRGEGDGEDGTVLLATARKRYTLILMSGTGGPIEDDATRQKITADRVPVGARTFTVSDTALFRPGDDVLVCREGNQAWIDELGMNKLNQGPEDSVKNWRPFSLKFQRVVTAVRGNEVTVDAPVVIAIERRYGGGSLVRVRHPGRIENAGVENLRGDSVYDSPADEAHAWRFIQINHAQDVWVRDVTARHMAYSCVQVDSQVRRATIQDSSCVDMISEIKGGLRYPFALSGQLCLVQRCSTRDGRHDFVMHAWVPGPNVFLDCRSERAHSDSGPHHRYATGTLYDNVETGTLNVVNRGRSGTGHGWAGAQMVFWNCRAERMNVARPPTAQNLAIGCTVKQKPRGDGYWESVNRPVEPRSLYLRQLEDRLGPKAVRNIAADAGREGSAK